MIAENITDIKVKIAKAAEKTKRDPKQIRLICVTKGRSLTEIKEAINCSILDIGENKVQEAEEKYNILKDGNVKWHLVGHLQTNKAKAAVKIFDLIHSLDSLKLASEIDRQAKNINKVQDCLIEVNTSGEASKFGVRPQDVLKLVKDVINLGNIRLLGLMTMAPVVKDKEDARPYFRKLRQIQSEINDFLLTVNRSPLTALSMGMSQDYEVAVEEGSTMVRIGTAIFENTNV